MTIRVWIVRKDSILLVVEIRQLCFKFVLLKHSAYKNYNCTKNTHFLTMTFTDVPRAVRFRARGHVYLYYPICSIPTVQFGWQRKFAEKFTSWETLNLQTEFFPVLVHCIIYVTFIKKILVELYVMQNQHELLHCNHMQVQLLAGLI